MPSSKSPVIIVGYNRFDYFTQVIDSVKHQLDGRKVHLLLDLPEDGNTYEQDRHSDYAQKHLSNLTIYLNSAHRGCNYNMVKARQIMFEEFEYERAFILEDDMVAGPGAFDFLENMMDWTDANYSNVGVVQGWAGRDAKDYTQDPFELKYGNSIHHWFFLQSKESWLKISELMKEYVDLFFTEYPYKTQQNYYNCLVWRNTKISNMIINKDNYPKDGFPEDQTFGWKEIEGNNIIHDSVTAAFFFLTNQAKVVPVIGRNKIIGERGEHFNPQHFKRKGLKDWNLYSHELDATQKEFTVH